MDLYIYITKIVLHSISCRKSKNIIFTNENINKPVSPNTLSMSKKFPNWSKKNRKQSKNWQPRCSTPYQ